MRKKAALIAFVIFVLVTVSCKKAKLAPRFNVVRASDGVVSIPVDSLKERVNFFTYRYRGRNIDFMIIRFSPEDIKTYLDADYLCYKAKMGFKVQGNRLICIHHNFAFDLNNPEGWRGNHVPIPLNSELRDGKIIIKEAILRKAYRFFR
jgi:uncharacterized membrane protein